MPRVLIEPVPLYIAAALGEIGVIEDTRPYKSAKRIEEYHAATTGGAMPDDVPWCSSFLCWCMERAGIRSTRSKAAASWLRWGAACAPRPWAVCVFGKLHEDARGTGHVALSLGLTSKYVYVIGGNQQNAVTIAQRATSEVLAWRILAPVASTPPSIGGAA
jgi:uncharacterized protein (TIGR02594 family)